MLPALQCDKETDKRLLNYHSLRIPRWKNYFCICELIVSKLKHLYSQFWRYFLFTFLTYLNQVRRFNNEQRDAATEEGATYNSVHIDNASVCSESKTYLFVKEL
jgi:hypothetical protein